MVVVGFRHVVASSALPSKTKPLQHAEEKERQQQHSDARVLEECFDVDMRELRASSAVLGRSVVTELKQMKKYARVNKSSTTSQTPPTAYAFVYGTLKKGFSNYWLMEEVCGAGHAGFLGSARTKQKFPMVCGPYQVPFLIDIPSGGHQVCGELYEVDRVVIGRLDELEGNYVRRSVVLSRIHVSRFTCTGLLRKNRYRLP